MARFIGAGEPDWIHNEEKNFGWSKKNVACAGLYSDEAKTEKLECRPVSQTKDYIVHDMSISWTNDDYRLNVGIRNVFNEAPPLVDKNGTFSNTNIPLGVGYDTFGRTPFINFTAAF
jgi:iron complex outermembrane receptor protein